MAKVSQPLGSSEARGSVGGYTYNTWRGLHTVKSKASPPFDPEGLQGMRFNYIRLAAQKWSTLSDEVRAIWDNYALTHFDMDWSGHPKRLAGYHWFVRCKSRQLFISFEHPDDFLPQDITCYPTDLIFNWTGSASEFGWSISQEVIPENLFIEFWFTPPMSPGRKATIKDARYWGPYYMTDLIELLDITASGTYTAFYRPVYLSGASGSFQSLKFVIP